MKRSLFITAMLIVLLAFDIAAQDDYDAYAKGLQAITAESVRGQLDFLASDWMQGRETGTQGAYMAADYIASIFSTLGIAPAGDIKWKYPSWRERMAGAEAEQYRTYFQEFTLVKYKAGEDQQFRLSNGGRSVSFAYETDFYLDPGSISREVSADIVFVGYGYVNEDEKYDDYKGVDVKGKIVVRLSGYPGHNDTASEAYKKFRPEGRYAEYYLSRDKNRIAGEKEVAGIIEITPGRDMSSRWIKNVPFRYNSDYYEGEENPRERYDYDIPEDTLDLDPVRIYLSKRAATELFMGTGLNLEEWEQRAKERMKPDSRALAGKSAWFRTSVESELIQVRNVLGMIEGEDSASGAIVAGAHYDHLGMRAGYIYNGADDNASGTVGVMNIAKACVATGQKPARTIVFAAWTGEEKGLLGSRYFVDHMQDPFKNVTLYLNYDMISRDDEDDTLKNQCRMSYTAGESYLEENTKMFVDKYGINLDINMNPTTNKGGGSDHSPFARKDIPFFYFMAGFPDEYHTPKDEVDKVNYDKMSEIIKIGFLNVWELAK